LSGLLNLLHPAGAFVVLADVLDGLGAEGFRCSEVYVGKFFHIDTGLAHLVLAEFFQCFLAFVRFGINVERKRSLPG